MDGKTLNEMRKIIINADDCGLSKSVNEAIEKCIINGEITSTTIMANMDDFKGACRLYEKYKDNISFGVHLNLTEGKPLTAQDALLTCGIAEKRVNGDVVFCGNKVRKYYFTKSQRKAIYKELDAQISQIINAGIRISHIDGHHHIHTDFWIMIEIVKLAKRYNIRKIRSIRNYEIYGISFFARQCWRYILKIIYPAVFITDWFTSYSVFAQSDKERIKGGQTIELMTHPSGYDVDKIDLLSNQSLVTGFKKITYNDL